MPDSFDYLGQVRRAANPAWAAWWLEATARVARATPYFTTDQIERLRQKERGPSTHENRAIGPLMLEAERLGFCEKTQDWIESRQRINHHRPMRVWRSKIYRGPLKRRYRRRNVIDPNQFDFELP